MKSRRIELRTVAFLALAWLVYLSAGSGIAGIVAARWGNRIVSATDGNVPDPRLFLQNRQWEALLLLTLAGALLLGYRLLAGLLLTPHGSRTRRWVFHAITGFAAFSVWLAAAANTTLFWGLLWHGRAETTALARFQLKNHLLREAPAPSAAIIGNSQARAQLDESLLNQELQGRLFTLELHFPGARAFDLWLLHRRLAPASTILCYVSEMTFYDPAPSEASALLFRFADWAPARSLGAFQYVPIRKVAYGLLGNVLPPFYLRDPFTQLVLGAGVSGIRQRQHDQGVAAERATVADSVHSGFQRSALSDFQKRAFEAFAADCTRKGQRLVIFAGQLNPRLGDQLDPAIREDMLAFLRRLQRNDASVVLIDDYPKQSESEYEDLTHVNPETQRRFTRFTAEKLRPILPKAVQ